MILRRISREPWPSSVIVTLPTRLLNQAFFKKLYVHQDGEISHELADPFKVLLDPELSKHLSQAPQSALGVGEQGRTKNRDGRPRNGFGPANGRAEISNYGSMVDQRGLEPVASTLSAAFRYCTRSMGASFHRTSRR